ncbi:DUF1854 domain-containing protein [Pigmentiphaga sp.]|uniref:cyanophycin metabolism-associated DUF1854 family protein n=1 Tax=Pigmentiphaga sp. TaxID=1977564 RepID=UPI00128C18E8|nr:DUF1854 domain-containing protein [Pigmentiphaga sp.]MPS28949.1 DUF1854 domain-containing protein [Alcaligenaceae bacterium SAGV5]MPS52812.1 DUF1854 domain-containing protein [Alcaligenaceae bacterium SAGV3]MPT56874.1 DUF1854 domain-containing protein [Alcaligenaceae bacterium]
MSFPYTLSRNAYGRLICAPADGGPAEEVTPVRAFPIDTESEDISLVGPGGHEVAWISRLADLPPAARELVREELGQREFMPEIQRIVQVASYVTPTTWTVRTNRGEARLWLKSEQDIRRISQSKLLISDGHGIHFLIRDLERLDRASRRILDRFL